MKHQIIRAQIVAEISTKYFSAEEPAGWYSSARWFYPELDEGGSQYYGPYDTPDEAAAAAFEDYLGSYADQLDGHFSLEKIQ